MILKIVFVYGSYHLCPKKRENKNWEATLHRFFLHLFPMSIPLLPPSRRLKLQQETYSTDFEKEKRRKKKGFSFVIGPCVCAHMTGAHVGVRVCVEQDWRTEGFFVFIHFTLLRKVCVFILFSFIYYFSPQNLAGGFQASFPKKNKNKNSRLFLSHQE